MTGATAALAGGGSGIGLARVREALGPVLERIAAGAVERERARTLPFEEVRLLTEAGFGALRVPVEHGGFGLSIPELASVLVDLAAADSNLPQIFRGHLAFVEDRLADPDRSAAGRWFERFAAGQIVGNAWSETGSATVGSSETALRRGPDGWRLSGRKYYTTGSIFADWVDVTATREDGEGVTVLVPSSAPGVSIRDDWDGFGQRLTGTGTAYFEDVLVAPEEVRPFSDRFTYQTALYQLILLCVQAGIARAARDDAAAALARRSRVYSHGLAATAADDGQLLAVVGRVASAAFVAEAAVERVGRALAEAAAHEADRGSAAHRRAQIEAELASAQAQVVLTESVPAAATLLFDALGASAISSAADLDRHWRNSRAVGSHNPAVYKARIVGDWFVNGTTPPFIWHIGAAPGPAAAEHSQEGRNDQHD